MGKQEPIPKDELEDLVRKMMEGTGVFSGDGPPPALGDFKIDLSRMHNLDHSIITCRGWGGRRHHAWLWWEFQGKRQMRAATLCRIGRHQKVTAFLMREGVALARKEHCTACEWETRQVPL